MKTTLLLFFFAFTTGICCAQEPVTAADLSPAGDTIYAETDEPATFPGGQPAMADYLKNNLSYPPIAVEKGIMGKCFLRLVIEKDGAVSRITVIKGIPGGPECDEEAKRLAKAMPSWVPARKNGRPIASSVIIPITFKLQ